MRAPSLVSFAATVFLTAATASVMAAQGILIPQCGNGHECIPLPCRTDVQCGQRISWNAAVTRGASHVHVTLGDGVLHYEVDETFVNHGGRIGEADYIFPLPRNAAFSDLKLSINGEMVGGETMDAQHARSIYEAIVRRQRDPALVEWMGYGMLRTRIFPILPGEQKHVVVRFDQVALREGDALRIDYAQGGRTGNVPIVRYASATSTDGGNTTFTLSYPVASGYGTPYSPTHELRFDKSGNVRNVYVFGTASDMTLLIPAPRTTRAAAITLLANSDGRDDGFALINLVPSASSRTTAPRDVTFVLDVSGSMAGRKMEQARAAGRQLLSTLAPGDRFRLIDFSSDVRTFRDGLSQATPENVRAANVYLDGLSAEGSTNISGALTEALRTDPGDANADRLRIVLFLTDGEPTIGERNPDAIAAEAAQLRGSARVFTFGLGADVNASLLEQIALQGRGTAQFVRPTEDVERAVSIVASRLTNPIATDLRVTADGVRLNRMLPGSPIDVFAGQNVVLLARYSGSGAATLHFEGNSANGPVHWTQRVNFPETERTNVFIDRLWATQRIGYLSAERRRAGGNAELDGEIRSLGERYGIPTEFTSFLVQEPLPQGRGVQVRSTQLSPGGMQLNEVVAAGISEAPAAYAFEAARQATAQRAVTSLAAADAVSPDDKPSGGESVHRAGGLTLTLVNGVWTDARLKANTVGSSSLVVRVQAYSAAYFRVLELAPSISAVLALGDRVVVIGRGVVLEIGPEGAVTLSARDEAALATAW